jgi:hypothetical protein
MSAKKCSRRSDNPIEKDKEVMSSLTEECDEEFDDNEWIEDFLSSLLKVDTDDLPDDFEDQWEAFICYIERAKRNSVSKEVNKPAHVDLFVKRGWATADREKLSVNIHHDLPPLSMRPVSVVLVYVDGKYVIPPSLGVFVHMHPFIREETETLIEMHPRELVTRRIAEVNYIEKSQEIEDYGLYDGLEHMDEYKGYAIACSNHAHLLKAALDDETILTERERLLMLEPEKLGWLRRAKNRNRLWEIIDEAINLGHALALWEVYGSGKVQEMARKSLLNPGGKKASEWGTEVKRFCAQYMMVVGKQPTPSELLLWLDGVRDPKDDNIPLRFTKLGTTVLDGILWNQFVNRVDAAKK